MPRNAAARRKAINPEIEAAWLKLAEHWLKLAETAEATPKWREGK
jgi:hypothetical protein